MSYQQSGEASAPYMIAPDVQPGGGSPVRQEMSMDAKIQAKLAKAYLATRTCCACCCMTTYCPCAACYYCGSCIFCCAPKNDRKKMWEYTLPVTVVQPGSSTRITATLRNSKKLRNSTHCASIRIAAPVAFHAVAA